jgi:hypothetical protein
MVVGLGGGKAFDRFETSTPRCLTLQISIYRELCLQKHCSCQLGGYHKAKRLVFRSGHCIYQSRKILAIVQPTKTQVETAQIPPDRTFAARQLETQSVSRPSSG